MADKTNDLLAEALDASGLGKYIWDPAPACPQGHEQWSFDYETRTVSWYCQPGEVCFACIEEAYDGLPHIDRMNIRGGMDRYRELVAIRDAFGPADHPEWRIGRVGRDLSDPTHVLLVLEAFADAHKNKILDVAPHFHRNTQKRGWEGVLELRVTSPSGLHEATKEFEGSGSSWGHAVCDALVSVVIRGGVE